MIRPEMGWEGEKITISQFESIVVINKVSLLQIYKSLNVDCNILASWVDILQTVIEKYHFLPINIFIV